jgi:hypothetical protein
MKRDVNVLQKLFKGKYGNPFALKTTPESIYGNDGEYFAYDGDKHSGQTHDKSIIDYNTPPGQVPYGCKEFNDTYAENIRREEEGTCQPGLWCQWIISEDGTELMWDEGEKFYNYAEWLKYLIDHFFSKWSILLNGEIYWDGEDSDDLGKIVVTNNEVVVKVGHITYE